MLTKITEDFYVILEEISCFKINHLDEFAYFTYRNSSLSHGVSLAEGLELKKAIDNMMDKKNCPF